jgi:pseudouridine synthase
MPARNPAKTLDRVLSRAGLCSRSLARELIAAGRVEVGGRIVRSAERWVDPERDAVRVDGKRLSAAERAYLALHKPSGVLTTLSDPEGRPTVYDLLRDVPVWLGPVGRLDRDTSGLLLFTNDTAFAERVTNPESELAKTYHVRSGTPLEPEQLEALRRGVLLDDGPTRPARVQELRRYAGYSLILLTITEGRNRQVRRMLRAVGSRVKKLRRVAIGPVELGRLPSGAHRRLTPAELRALGVPRAGARS